MRQRFVIVLLILGATGFGGWKFLNRPVDISPKPITIGHGGAGSAWFNHLDSWAGFQKAIDLDMDGSEVDVVGTKDGVLLAFHDWQLSETGECIGAVSELTYLQVLNCVKDVLTIDSVLRMGWKNGSTFSLDLKVYHVGSENHLRFLQSVSELTNKYPEFNFLIEVNGSDQLRWLNSLGCRAELFQLTPNYYSKFKLEDLPFLEEPYVDGISIRNEQIDAETIAQIHDLGKKVMIWSVGTPWHNRDAVMKGADIIQTDDLRSAKNILR